MKLDYKIMWVEDKIDTRPFERIRRGIEQHLENEFFNVEIETAEDFNEFKEKYDGTDSFDLIITDMNLNESHGSSVIDFIRDTKHVLTEIFFYSANSELTNSKLVNSSRITFHQMNEAGAYKELETSIIELINLTIAKFQHIVTMRGMIMQETSSLDAKTLEMAHHYIQYNDDEVRTALFDELISFFSEKLKKAEKSKTKNNISLIVKDPLILTSAQRANVLSKIIEKKGSENFIDDFKREIIQVRNRFAHSKLMEDESGRQFFMVKNEAIPFDENACRDIRKQILKHANNIAQLEKVLS